MATLLFALVGCSEDSSGTSSNLSGTQVSITDSNEAMLALGALGAEGGLIDLGSTDLSEYTDSDDIPHAASPSLAPVDITLNCQRWGEDTADGVFTAVGDISDTSYDMKYTYSECWVNNYVRYIGSKTLVGTANDNNLVTLNITTTNYNRVGSYMMNTSAVAKFYTDGTAGLDILLNGKIDTYYAYNSVEYINKMGFDDFHYVADINGHETIDGKASVTGLPKSCADGIYTLETLEQIVPDGDGASAGKIKVNDVTYQFNNDGSVSVTFVDGSTDQFMFADVADANCSL